MLTRRTQGRIKAQTLINKAQVHLNRRTERSMKA